MQNKYLKTINLQYLSDKKWLEIIFKLEALANIEFKHTSKTG
ncbi:MAG: hypothetical protein ACPGSD_02820 [Flavobacteriales bacterium]